MDSRHCRPESAAPRRVRRRAAPAELRRAVDWAALHAKTSRIPVDPHPRPRSSCSLFVLPAQGSETVVAGISRRVHAERGMLDLRSKSPRRCISIFSPVPGMRHFGRALLPINVARSPMVEFHVGSSMALKCGTPGRSLHGPLRPAAAGSTRFRRGSRTRWANGALPRRNQSSCLQSALASGGASGRLAAIVPPKKRDEQ